MSISTNGKLLVQLTKELSVKWEQTKDCWHDAKSEEFERRFLVELLAGANRAAPIFDELDKLVTKVRNDCE